MSFITLVNALANFVAPALALALLVPLLSRFFAKKRPGAGVFITHAAINFVAGVLVLCLGLGYFGHDGKMATYAALVLAVATCQWLMQRGR